MEWFFPEHGQTSARGKAVCAGCPCRAECLSEALSVPESGDSGVWGGTTERERSRMRGGPDVCPDCGGRFTSRVGPGRPAERCVECRRLLKLRRNEESRVRRIERRRAELAEAEAERVAS